MHKLLGNLKEGIVFIVSAPAGTGKTTLVRMLCEEFDCVLEGISYTTRPRRKDEVEGRDYYFISTEEFERKIKANEFLEYAKVFNAYYGTSKRMVEEKRKQGKHVVLVIDTQGAFQVMEQTECVSIFFTPPGIEELKRRLFSRKSESEDAIEHRLSWAEREIAASKKYNYCIVNDHLETAYQVLRSILIAEEHRTKRLEFK